MIQTQRPTITLQSNDSINLTTGVVTRSHSDRLRGRNLKGLRANYLVVLQLMIDQDPSIPACGLTGKALPGFRFERDLRSN